MKVFISCCPEKISPEGMMTAFFDGSSYEESNLRGRINLLVQVPHVKYESTIMRKFIVFVGQDLIAIIIGPPLSPRSYYHRELRSLLPSHLGTMKLSGGGSVTQHCIWRERGDSAELCGEIKFGGQSGDYGVYDARMLDPHVRECIAIALDNRRHSIGLRWEESI